MVSQLRIIEQIECHKIILLNYWCTGGLKGSKSNYPPPTHSPQNLQSYLSGYDFDKGLEVTWPILVLIVAERDK